MGELGGELGYMTNACGSVPGRFGTGNMKSERSSPDIKNSR